MANAKAKASPNARALLQHDYCGSASMETNSKGTKNTLTSPAKPPAPQKRQKGEENTPVGPHAGATSNDAILSAIGSLKNMMEEFKEDLKQNTITINSITKLVEYNSAEIKECKEKNKELGREMKQLKEKNTELEKRAGELERYKRRWNLRLNGLKEEKEENTRQIIKDIVGKIVPQWKENMDFIIDSVHRLCPCNADRPRQIIMQFTARHFRDELWRTTKNHSICKELNIRFAEDLTKEDREARKAVWPKIEQARKAGLKTMFRGPHAFINGQRVLP